ncbi:uncharacterized protein [Rutidosis leptorrhynchoides]|uniref:uncharacterized protein n=1 Tax=Rutidosis leptorrhynchoides TaxID=125765 RepID=UPI003A9A1F75
MAHQLDDDDIEQHLIEKISQAIIVSGKKQNNIVIRLLNLSEPDFITLLNKLKETTNPNVVKDWMSLRRASLYELNNLLSDWLITKSQTLFSPIEIRNSYENIKKSLRRLTKEVNGEEDTSSRGKKDATIITDDDNANDEMSGSYDHDQEPNHTIFIRNKNDVYRWSSRHKPSKIYGLEHIVMAMERDIVIRNINAPYQVYGVVGVAGIGKTTLCQEIFNRDLVKQHFSPRLWVCLSKQPNNHKDDYKQEVVVRMLKCLGIEDDVINAAGNGDKYGLKRLILLLRLQLIGKRYLIVLDDAWCDKLYVTKHDKNNKTNEHDANDDTKTEDTYFWNLTQKDELDEKTGHDQLAYALPKGCGGTIISSSRSQTLVKKMFGKDVSLQCLKPQKDENIDKIFDDEVIGYDEGMRELPQHLKDLKGKILEKCDRIPLGAKLLAKIAREQLQQKTNTTSAGGQVPAGGNAGDGGVPKSKAKNDTL